MNYKTDFQNIDFDSSIYLHFDKFVCLIPFFYHLLNPTSYPIFSILYPNELLLREIKSVTLKMNV